MESINQDSITLAFGYKSIENSENLEIEVNLYDQLIFREMPSLFNM